MSTTIRVLKNTGFLYAKMGITMFISLYNTNLILNTLGASDFGIFNIVGGAIAMLGFLNGAMAGATQRFMSYTKGQNNIEKQKKIFNISVILHFSISIIIGITLIGAGYFFFNGILNIESDRVFAAKVVYTSLIVSTIFTVMTVPYDALLNAHENMLYYAIVGIIESLLKLIIAFAVVYTDGDKLILYGILMAFIPLITMSIMRIYCHQHYSECHLAPKKYWDFILMKEMTGFAGWNFIATAGSMIGFYGQGIIINIFFGTVVNAAQGIASQINGQLSVFVNSMQKALNPVIIKKEGSGDRSSMLSISLVGAKVSYFLLLLISLPVMANITLLLKLWLRNVPEETYIFCQLTLVRSLIEQLFITLSTSISATGNIKRVKIGAALSSLLALAISYGLFSKGFLPNTMYYIFICSTLVTYIFVLYEAKIHCGLSILSFINNILSRCIIVTIPLIVFCTIYTTFFVATVFNFTLFCLMYFILFLSLVYILGLDNQEKKILQAQITRFNFSFFN